MGSKGLVEIADRYKIGIDRNMQAVSGNYPALPWETTLLSQMRLDYEHRALAMEVLRDALKYNPDERPSATKLLQYSYFKDI